MFSYNYYPKEHKLYVTVPSKVKYNFSFLNSITELMDKVENSNCKEIYFSCNSQDITFDKMGTAYLENTIKFFTENRSVYAGKYLIKRLQEKVSHTDGTKFEKINVNSSLDNSTLQCYCYADDKDVNQTAQIIVDFISDHNLMLKDAKEFLITTIGEIFSNAFNHSNKKKVFFMYDIELHNDTFFLVINITDYGKTIINNVQEYQRKITGELWNGNKCIEWAMQDGNTTRKGSGGYGLPTLVDYVKGISGELLIFSGNSLYALKKNHENILNAKGVFSGTSVSMKIPLFDNTRIIAFDEESNRIISIDLDKI